VHELRPECKLAAALLFLLAVVATPREAAWAYGCFGLLLWAATRLARVGIGFVCRRIVFEAPFIGFALLLPFIAGGVRTSVFGVALSVDGLWAAWNIAVKATLGLWTMVLLAATTEVAEILRGLERLGFPRIITGIAGFMVRYADVVTGEMSRMRIARASRAYDPRWLWEARALAASAGTLFIRSFERGERVYVAMLSRGFDGHLPASTGESSPPSQWAAALLLPAAGAAVFVAARAAV
jgi:cobalt/nickel transport system permease protein